MGGIIEGNVRYEDGMVYEWNFEKGRRQGKGKMLFEDRSSYEGMSMIRR